MTQPSFYIPPAPCDCNNCMECNPELPPPPECIIIDENGRAFLSTLATLQRRVAHLATALNHECFNEWSPVAQKYFNEQYTNAYCNLDNYRKNNP